VPKLTDGGGAARSGSVPNGGADSSSLQEIVAAVPVWDHVTILPWRSPPADAAERTGGVDFVAALLSGRRPRAGAILNFAGKAGR